MKPLTPGELEVMEVLWKHGRLKPAEILEQLERPQTNNALRSVLKVLLDKGHVTRHKQGKAYYYESRQTAPTALKTITSRLADVFCGGSSFELIARLVKSQKLTPEEVQQLQEIMAAADQDSPTAPHQTEDEA